MSRPKIRSLLASLVVFAAVVTGCTVVSTTPHGESTIQQAILDTGNDGGIVFLEDGNYGDQTIRCPSVSERPKRMTLVIARHPGKVHLTNLDSQCDRVTYDGLTISAQNQDAKGALYLSGNNVTLQNSTVGDVLNEKNIVSGTNVTLKNNTFHDVWMNDAGVARDVHQECIYLMDAPGAKILNNTFRHCGVMDLMVTRCTWCSPPYPEYGGLLIEGNDFGVPDFPNKVPGHYYGLLWHGQAIPTVRDTIVRNNIFRGGVNADQPWVNSVRCGNTGPGATGVWAQPC